MPFSYFSNRYYVLKLKTFFTLNTIFTSSFVLKVLVVRPKVLCVPFSCKSKSTSFTAKRRGRTNILVLATRMGMKEDSSECRRYLYNITHSQVVKPIRRRLKSLKLHECSGI